MKIVQYLGSLDACGAESVVKDYAVALSKRGHEVIVPIYYDASNSPNQKILLEHSIRIDVIRGVYKRNIFFRAYNKILTIAGFNRKYVKALLKKENPDILHLHGYVLEDFKNLDEELYGIKLFYTCHNPPQEFFCGKNKNQFDIAKKLINRYGMRLIALSPDMACELNNMFGINNTIVLNNPIDINRFKYPTKERIAVRNELGIPNSAFVIGHVGRFHEQKNHIFLVDVFNKICSCRKNAFLLLVASSEVGTQKEVFQKIHQYGLEDRIKILYDRDDVENLYSAMDVFVFPSLFEGLGLAFLEAQIAGLKCVISEGVSREGIVSSNVLQLSLNTDLNKWVEAILNQKAYHEVVQKIENFDIENVIDQLIILYLE